MTLLLLQSKRSKIRLSYYQVVVGEIVAALLLLCSNRRAICRSYYYKVIERTILFDYIADDIVKETYIVIEFTT